ncbi:TetR/AcrR family transcriptional regulator [Halomarina oriensis]|uniref:TetR family transcriptional regulator n=1 Tax=Halomarina oriensis TaxID=671145 RepID=A0A6B0GM50_9EURY|nr:TetR/AcrR family transcriptional regulator [Halomarina oriensis]MWG35730.1 TetR family transcriptional regulator [Halomarina oriensis]
MSADTSSDDCEDTREAIMKATYRALRDNGTADLTIQNIADEFEKSKSLLYYHYETKDDLLVEFLGWLIDRNAEFLDSDDVETTVEFVEAMIPPEVDEERAGFRAAFVQMRAEAASDPDYREQFTLYDRLFRETLVELIERDIEAGRLRAVDVDALADVLLSTIDGAMLRYATTDDDVMPTTREGVDRLLASLRGDE